MVESRQKPGLVASAAAGLLLHGPYMGLVRVMGDPSMMSMRRWRPAARPVRAHAIRDNWLYRGGREEQSAQQHGTEGDTQRAPSPVHVHLQLQETGNCKLESVSIIDSAL